MAGCIFWAICSSFGLWRNVEDRLGHARFLLLTSSRIIARHTGLHVIAFARSLARRRDCVVLGGYPALSPRESVDCHRTHNLPLFVECLRSLLSYGLSLNLSACLPRNRRAFTEEFLTGAYEVLLESLLTLILDPQRRAQLIKHAKFEKTLSRCALISIVKSLTPFRGHAHKAMILFIVVTYLFCTSARGPQDQKARHCYLRRDHTILQPGRAPVRAHKLQLC